MTGFEGDQHGPWSTSNSQTIVPGTSKSFSVKKVRHEAKLHAVQSHFLGDLKRGVPCFDPGDHLCVLLARLVLHVPISITHQRVY
jgi:hypothetical protein